MKLISDTQYLSKLPARCNLQACMKIPRSFDTKNQNRPVAYPGILFGRGGVQQIQLMGDSWRGSLFIKLKKWVKPVFLLSCYGCIFHGTGNSAQLCQNFGISGVGGLNSANPPPRYVTETDPVWGHVSLYTACFRTLTLLLSAITTKIEI
jgi:hypothetical protein